MNAFKKIIWFIIAIQTVLLFVVINYFDIEDTTLLNKSKVEFDSGWVIIREDGSRSEISSLPYSEKCKAGQMVVIENDIPKEYWGQTLSFLSADKTLNVYIDDELVYEFGQNDKRLFGHTSGSIVNFIEIPNNLTKGHIRIEMKSPYDNYAADISKISIAKNDIAVLDLIKNNLANIICCIIILFCAIIFGILVTVRMASHRSLEGMQYLGMMAFLSSIYYFIETKTLSLFYGNSTLYSVFVFLILMDLPMFLILYYENSVPEKYCKILTFLQILIFCNITVQILLQVSNFVDFMNMAIYSHSMIFLTAIIILVLFVRIIFIEKRYDLIMEFISLLFLFLGSIIDIIRNYMVKTGDLGKFSRYGMTVFCVTMLIEHIRRIAKKYSLNIKQLEIEKERADAANVAKSQFLSNMSHEIRTPMNGVIGMTDILLRSDLNDKEREYAVNIKHSGEALLSIINDILDFSKIESGKFDLIEDEYELLPMLYELKFIFDVRIGEKPIELEYDIEKKLPSVMYGDVLRIRQIVTNLVNNAIKYTDKGKIVLKVRTMEISETKKVNLSFFVSDTGHGIKDEDISKLFGAFSQVDIRKNRKQEGTGLGLSICKSLVELMGGTIGVDSTYNVGSTFYFTIPQKVIDATPAKYTVSTLEKKADVENFTAPDARILVVDDNEMNLNVCKGLLEPLKINIDVVDSGKGAIEKVKKNHYDLVFMDHMMPVMDGIECTALIRSEADDYNKKLPIIALSSNAIAGVREMFIAAGMNDFIPKPINYAEICKVIRKYLPESYIHVGEISEQGSGNSSDVKTEKLEIPGLDVEQGIINCGSEKLYKDLLGDYYRLIDIKSAKIEECLKEGLIKDYEIEVHALKSTSRMIGEEKLSKQFYNLEKCAGINDIETLQKETPIVLQQLRAYKSVLAPFGESKNENKKDCTADEIIEILTGIKEAVDQFDLDSVDVFIKELDKLKLPEEIINDMQTLRAYVSDVAMENIVDECNNMISKIS